MIHDRNFFKLKTIIYGKYRGWERNTEKETKEKRARERQNQTDTTEVDTHAGARVLTRENQKIFQLVFQLSYTG